MERHDRVGFTLAVINAAMMLWLVFYAEIWEAAICFGMSLYGMATFAGLLDRPRGGGRGAGCPTDGAERPRRLGGGAGAASPPAQEEPMRTGGLDRAQWTGLALGGALVLWCLVYPETWASAWLVAVCICFVAWLAGLLDDPPEGRSGAGGPTDVGGDDVNGQE